MSNCIKIAISFLIFVVVLGGKNFAQNIGAIVSQKIEETKFNGIISNAIILKGITYSNKINYMSIGIITRQTTKLD